MKRFNKQIVQEILNSYGAMWHDVEISFDEIHSKKCVGIIVPSSTKSDKMYDDLLDMFRAYKEEYRATIFALMYAHQEFTADNLTFIYYPSLTIE